VEDNLFLIRGSSGGIFALLSVLFNKIQAILSKLCKNDKNNRKNTRFL